MDKKIRLITFILIGFLASPVSHAVGQTADAIMQNAIANIHGPAGKMVVSEGKMVFSRRNLDIRTARYHKDGTEGFQIDVLSPVEDQEVPGSTPQTNKKYRVIRKGKKISTLTYLPSLRRGRKINYVPLDGLLGSDFPYYLLPLGSDFLHDFSYRFVTQAKPDLAVPVLVGSAKEGNRSPYSQVTVSLERRGETYLIVRAAYQLSESEGKSEDMTVQLENFSEFTPGYWAPVIMRVKETTFMFDVWTVWEPRSWLHSTNHNLFDAQQLPQFRTLTAN